MDDDGDDLSYTWVTNEGEIAGGGDAIEWTARDAEGLYRVSVRVEDGRSGTAEHPTSLRVKANSIPEITVLSSLSDWVMPAQSSYLSCSALDLDGDEVVYEWSATAGDVFGQGRSIVWAAPAELGSHFVRATAGDACGGQSTREIAISVVAGTAPMLGTFTVRGIGADLVRQFGDVWGVFRGRSCCIECEVLDREGPFSYSWAGDTGTLTADGPVAGWDALEREGLAGNLNGLSQAGKGCPRARGAGNGARRGHRCTWKRNRRHRAYER